MVWPPLRIKDNAKLFRHMWDSCAQFDVLRKLSTRSSAVAMSRIAPCCLMLISSIRRSLHAVIYIHELSETALCAARASPRRRVRSRARKTRLQNKAPRSPRRSYPSRGRDLRPEHVVGRPAPRPPGPFRKNLCFRGFRANERDNFFGSRPQNLLYLPSCCLP